MRRTILLVGLAALLGVVGCHEEGHGQKVGKKLDEAIDKLTHPNEGPLEKLGRKTDEAIDDAKEAIDDATKKRE